MNTTLEQHIGAAVIDALSGYQVLGRGVEGFDGVEIATSGPGSLVPMNWNEQIRAVNGEFLIVKVEHSGEHYTKSFKFHAREIARFSLWADLQNWLAVNGKPAEPGSGPNVWD